MIGADLERLGLPHEKPNLARSLMLQELHGARASLLPLVPILVEPVKLRFAAIREEQASTRTRVEETQERESKKEE